MSVYNVSAVFYAYYVIIYDDSTRDDTAWWKARGDFEHSEPPNNAGSKPGTDSDGESDAVSSGSGSTLGSLECNHDNSDKRTARFTEYSMTSSVIPRSEGVLVIWLRMHQRMKRALKLLRGTGKYILFRLLCIQRGWEGVLHWLTVEG